MKFYYSLCSSTSCYWIVALLVVNVVGMRVVWVVGESSTTEERSFPAASDSEELDERHGSLSGSSWGSIFVNALPPLWSDLLINNLI